MPSSGLKKIYREKVIPELSKEFEERNVFALPQIKKVVVNMGVGEGAKDKAVIEKASQDLAMITGQKPKVDQSRQSIAGFHLREGAPIGITVTLRGQRMYDFLEKLFRITLPRLRDFRGLSGKSFDGRGNYSLGLTESSVFPEMDLAKVERSWGLQITIVTGCRSDTKAKRLLELLGMPFEKGN